MLKDHLGNVRMVLTEKRPATSIYQATIEDAMSYTGDQRREFSYHHRQFIYRSAIQDRDSNSKTKNYNNDSELNRVSRAVLRMLDKFRSTK